MVLVIPYATIRVQLINNRIRRQEQCEISFRYRNVAMNEVAQVLSYISNSSSVGGGAVNFIFNKLANTWE